MDEPMRSLLEDGSFRLDVWCAALVALLVSYLVAVIALVTALELGGWDLVGAYAAAFAIPALLGFGLLHAFTPLKDRGFQTQH